MARRRPVSPSQIDVVLGLLEGTKKDLEAYLDLKNESVCGIPKEQRAASVAYLSSWVEGPLELAIRRLKKAVDPYEEPNA